MTKLNTDPNFHFNTETLFAIPLITDEQEFKERKIDDVLAWLAANDPNSSIKSFEMLDHSSEIKYFQDRRYELEHEQDWTIHQRLFQHQREVSEIEQNTVLENFVGPAHQAELELDKIIQEKIKKLDENRNQDISLISSRYQTLIKQCDQRLDLARKYYDESYERWREEKTAN